MFTLFLRGLALALCALTAVATGVASADPPPIEPPSVTPPAFNNGEVPGGSDVSKGLAAALGDVRVREEQLEEPDLAQERGESHFAYTQMDSRSEVADLLRLFFGDELAALNQDPARFLTDGRLEQRFGLTGARVSKDGEAALLESGFPVVAKDDYGHMRKVDLSLEQTADGLAATNPLVEIGIANAASEGISFATSEGLVVIQPMIDDDADAVRFGDKNALYANIELDRDLLVGLVANGVETFDQLRSAKSPEQLRYDLQLPVGTELVPDGIGGANVVKDSQTILHISFPTAVDAQGSDVPVELEIEGSSVVLHVEHRDRDVAYPILVDPFYELGESWNWYGGSNLNALSDGTWVWGSNVGWIYGSTSCIYACWGSGRGLFVSTPNGAFNGNQFGQWTYTPPGSTSYVTGASLNPFWRSNHNCSKSQYPQPHDYAGIWSPTNPNGWDVFRADHANDYGNAQLSAIGRVLVVGIGTGPGGSNPCWRDIMLGGASVWISDPDNPTWNGTPSVSPTWTDTAMLPINVSASDAGLGVKYFNLFTSDAAGNPVSLIGNAVHPCSGLKASPCPGSWSTQITNYSPAGLPNGVRSLALRAYDPLHEIHYSGQAVFLKVDHAAPVIKATGELLSSNPIKYHLDVDADDGSSASLATAQSGMKKLEFFLDGQYQGAWPSENPSDCVNPQQGLDLGSCKFEGVDVDLPRLLDGKHTLKVVALDSLGHPATQTYNLDLPKDVTAPKATVSGPLKAAAGNWVAAKASAVTVEAEDVETGVTEATVFVDGEEVITPTVQACKLGGCSLKQSLTVDLLGYEQGPHTVKVVARDGAGNATQTSWTVTVDPTPPTLKPTTTPEVPSGWTPQLSSLSVGFTVADTGPGGNGSGITKVDAIVPLEGGGSFAQTLYLSSCKGTTESPCPQEATGAKSLIFFSFIAQGTVQLPVKAYDFAGNITTQTITLRVDREAPKVKATGPLVEAAAGTLVGAGSKLDLTVTDKGGGLGILELLLDGKVEETITLEEVEADGGKQTCSGETCTLTYSFIPEIGSNLASGNHTLMIRAKDKVNQTGSLSKEVTLDTGAPEIALSGLLAESAGQELKAAEAGLKVVATDPSSAFTSGIKWIIVAVDGQQVAVLDSCKAVPCAPTGELTYTYKEAEWGTGPHQVEVLVTDWVGTTVERRVAVNSPITAVAPECPTGPQETVEAASVVTPAEASQLLAAAVPPAVAPTEPSASEPAAESPFDPSVAEEGQHSINELGIDATGTPTGGGIEDAPAGDFTVGQALCMQPLQKTNASSAPIDVGGDAVLYANSAPETDTVVRPTAYGTTIVEHRRGPAAPSSFSWEVKLRPGEELRKLANGSVVVVKSGVNVNEVEVPSSVPALDPSAIPEVEIQLLRHGANLAEANNAVEAEVMAVVAPPQAVLGTGATAPALLQISGGTIVTATLPPNVVADTIALIIEANTAPDPAAMCAHVFAPTPGLYVNGCNEDGAIEEEPPPSPDEWEELHHSSWEPLIGSGGAKVLIDSPSNPIDHDKAWCLSRPDHAVYCGYFKEDKKKAEEKTAKLFNIVEDATKSNAFQHSYWVALMVNSKPPDDKAFEFAMNHEKSQEDSDSRSERYNSRMDKLNNRVGYKYATNNEQSDQGACEAMVSKVGPAIYVGGQRNPAAWANRNGWQAYSLVYRIKYVRGVRVHLVSQDCG